MKVCSLCAAKSRTKKALSVMLAVIILVGCMSTAASAASLYSKYDDSEKVTLLVELKSDALLKNVFAKKHGVGAFFSSEAAEGAIKALENLQSEALSKISNRLSGNTELLCTYNSVFNGFAIKGTRADAAKLRSLSFIKGVYISAKHKMVTPFAADSKTVSSDIITNLSALRSLGYTGKGSAIAILDTSLAVDHEAMTLSSADGIKYSKSQMKELLTSSLFNYSSLKAGWTYKSDKIPFAYDYAGNDTNVGDITQSHGTHVAGIAAGNSAAIKGVAPEAQILFFKVFNGETAEDKDILKGLDDAVKFDVASINMSLGADCAMANNDETLSYDGVFGTARAAGIPVFCAAGNISRGYEENISPEDIDYSTSGMPSLANNATSVGAATTDETGTHSCFFSAYAVSDSLKLGLDISAPGENIYSSVPGGYSVESGTSMATPYVAGTAAILGQYLKEAYPALSVNRAKLLDNLMMSTATIIRESNGVPFSPAVQGAGLLNIKAAAESKCIMYADSGDTKINLYDNIGTEFSFTFTVENITDTEAVYTGLAVEAMTDGTRYTDIVDADGNTVMKDAGPFIYSQQRLLSDAHFDCGDTLSVPAHGKKEVSVSVTLDTAQIAELKGVFKNGFYLEGFAILNGPNETEISLPFLGFIGNWLSQPLIKPYSHIDETGYTYLHTDYAISGVNYFDESIGNAAWASFSPNNDGYADSLDLYIGLLRGAKSLNIRFMNSSGRVITETTEKYCGKFNPLEYTLTLDENGKVLPDGNYKIVITGILDYPGAKEFSVSLPFKIDTKAPAVLRQSFVWRNGKTFLKVAASDSTAVQGGRLSGNTLSTIATTVNAAAYNGYIEFDITGLKLSDFSLTVYDYAFNGTTVKEASADISNSVSYILPAAIKQLTEILVKFIGQL